MTILELSLSSITIITLLLCVLIPLYFLCIPLFYYWYYSPDIHDINKMTV
jgi:hypothetical protein